MTEPEQGRTPHTTEPAEGADSPGADVEGTTPHPEQPAEGADDPAVTEQSG